MKKNFLFLALVFLTFTGFSQEVEISCQEQPLSQLLVGLRDRYHLQLSFDDAYLSGFKITASQKFPSPEKAFDFILSGLPVTYEKVGGVFLFYKKTEEAIPFPKSYLLSGNFVDYFSHESLPYTHVIVNGQGMVTDQEGNFSFISKDEACHLQASYLGYYLLDTMVVAETRQQFLLTPASYKLKEVEVRGTPVVLSLQIGNKPGVLRINHQIAQYLPGNGDNSVFNLLRLQPGILAAGEQSNDLIIWGSYEGQTQVLFDGFTLFGMKNFNDNISAVNPFMAKDIQVLKGAYGAEHGGRVGGLVNITGIDGDVNSTRLKLSINNMTLNSMLSIPVTGQSAFILAFRQTYYELYDSQQLSFQTGRSRNSTRTIDRILYPDYNFRDLNLKYSGKNKNGDTYSISALMAEDRYSNTLNSKGESTSIVYEDHENNKQYGVSAFYQKNWSDGARTKVSVAYSSLNKETHDVRQFGRRQPSSGPSGMGQGRGGKGGNGQGGFQTYSSQDLLNLNTVTEGTVKLDHHIPLTEKHQLELGVGAVLDQINFREDTFAVNVVNQNFEGSRFNGYIQDAISLGKVMDVKLGIRANYSLNMEKLYVEPRFSSSIHLVEDLKMNFAAGLYNQFISRSSLIDDDGNYHYLWSVCDNQSIPVQEATHLVAGITYQKDQFTFSVEGFDKRTDGLTRYVKNFRVEDVFLGDSKSRGLDFFLKQDYKGHSIWVSYTLSETLERFDYFPRPIYRRALQDQRHELKTALLLNFNPFHFSANYVFGSGFPDPRLTVDGEFERNYSRLDVAATYTLNTRKFNLEGGFSILNVLNYANFKYANFVILPDDQDTSLNLHAEAIPFTPTVFLNFSF